MNFSQVRTKKGTGSAVPTQQNSKEISAKNLSDDSSAGAYNEFSRVISSQMLSQSKKKQSSMQREPDMFIEDTDECNTVQPDSVSMNYQDIDEPDVVTGPSVASNYSAMTKHKRLATSSSDLE